MKKRTHTARFRRNHAGNLGLWYLALCFSVLSAAPSVVLAQDGIRFIDIVPDPASGIVFEHGEPPRNAILDEMKQNPFQLPEDLALVPHKPHGAPGVALLDFDGDGDLDVYVTNSKGSGNGLFSNQLEETGETTFVDVAVAAGVDAVDHDSSGVCFGDIDNDGDHDLMVLGAIEPNRLFENQGEGTFLDITEQAGVGGGNLSTSSCSMGDVNGDGLLDIAVANTHTSWENLLGIVIPFTFNEHNQLFVNQGANIFADRSAASGFETLATLPPEAASLTWALALVDYDLDGDLDAFTFDDQGSVPLPQAGGPNYGIIHLHQNDGAGNFTDVTVDAGLEVAGSWMGVSFGDLNCDGALDLFATNVGDYPPTRGPLANPVGSFSTRWFLGSPEGTFTAPGPGALNGSVFGWGTSILDYDNDGDPDIAYHGGIDLGAFVHLGLPGVLLENQECSANFTFVDQAFARTPERIGRVGQGMAAGDLNRDGFVDVVTVSNSDLPASVPKSPTEAPLGSVFDPLVRFAEIFVPGGTPGQLVWSGLEGGDGSLTVELNSAESDNRSAAVTLRGSVGTLPTGRVNRDGIGAVVTFKTPGGKAQMAPVVGGASYASQDSLTVHLGLGTEAAGSVEVLWPGGVRNRLRGLEAGEHLTFPEIPCDLGDEFVDPAGYRACVDGALDSLVDAGILAAGDRQRFFDGAFTCEGDGTTLCLHGRRFEAEVEWTDFEGNSGSGRVIPAGLDDSGLFAFFNPDHVEFHLKVIDGCDLNGHFWVFGAASTNVEYLLRVTDLATGEERTYTNSLGSPAEAVTDTEAFTACL